MKKFNFKLKAFQKLRVAKEEQAKIALGKINKEIQSIQEKIVEAQRSIQGFNEEENIELTSGISGRNLKLYPEQVAAFVKRINDFEIYKADLIEERGKCLKELIQKKNERKIVDKLELQEYEKFKKDQNKKMEQDLQDTFLITRHKRVS